MGKCEGQRPNNYVNSSLKLVQTVGRYLITNLREPIKTRSWNRLTTQKFKLTGGYQKRTQVCMLLTATWNVYSTDPEKHISHLVKEDYGLIGQTRLDLHPPATLEKLYTCPLQPAISIDISREIS